MENLYLLNQLVGENVSIKFVNLKGKTKSENEVEYFQYSTDSFGIALKEDTQCLLYIDENDVVDIMDTDEDIQIITLQGVYYLI